VDLGNFGQERRAKLAQPKPAPKKPSYSIRFDLKEREAIEKAASTEERSGAFIVRRAALAWLREKGFLKSGHEIIGVFK